MPRRLAAAMALSATLVLAVGHRPVAACSWVPPTLDEAARGAQLLFVATVSEVPAPRTYVVDVERAFRGEIPETLVYSPEPGSVGSSCDAALEVGGTYLFAPQSLEGPLTIGDVWFELDGQDALGVYLLNYEGDVDDLLARLSALPDTALPRETPSSPVGIAGIGLLVLVAPIVLAIRARERARLGHAGGR